MHRLFKPNLPPSSLDAMFGVELCQLFKKLCNVLSNFTSSLKLIHTKERGIIIVEPELSFQNTKPKPSIRINLYNWRNKFS